MLGYQRGSKCPAGQSRVSEEQGFSGYSKHTDFILKRRLLCVCVHVCLLVRVCVLGSGEAKQKCKVVLCTGWLTD